MDAPRKKYLLTTLTFCCLISLAFYYFFVPVINDEKGNVFVLRPGKSKHVVITELYQQKIIKHPILLTLFTLTQKNTLKTGEYHFAKGSTLHTIWKQMMTGTGLYYRHFTLVPGWTFRQLRDVLNQAVHLRHLTLTWDDKKIMQHLNHADLFPEGEFFPETYNYTLGDTDVMILKKAFNLMQTRLQHLWQYRDVDLPFDRPYDVLIVASMIEKEAYLDNERFIIAGVLVNRFKKEMLLQIDATVIYGLGSRYTGKIYKENLLQDTAYNTYLHKGLPPTPIAMPGYASLYAAMHPQQHNYYYYVAKSGGSHQFSSSLQAHHEAVQENQTRTAPNDKR